MWCLFSEGMCFQIHDQRLVLIISTMVDVGVELAAVELDEGVSNELFEEEGWSTIIQSS